MDQAQAIVQALPWVLTVMGGGGILRALYVAHRATKAMETVEALDRLIRGNGGEDWSFPETRRRVAALARKADEYHETLHGEHGIYTKLAVHDAQVLQWATWRHEVIDKELNRIGLEVGAHDDDIEDLRKELSQCERRK